MPDNNAKPVQKRLQFAESVHFMKYGGRPEYGRHQSLGDNSTFQDETHVDF